MHGLRKFVVFIDMEFNIMIFYVIFIFYGDDFVQDGYVRQLYMNSNFFFFLILNTTNARFEFDTSRYI